MNTSLPNENSVAGLSSRDAPRVRGVLRSETARGSAEQYLARMRERLAGMGMTLMDTTWHGMGGRYRFTCERGHELSRIASGVMVKGRKGPVHCPDCLAEDVMSQLDDIARRAGGHFLSDIYSGKLATLSTVYNGINAKYLFRCARGHEWNVVGAAVMRTAWCNRCFVEQRRLPDGLAALHQAASRRDGVCLATQYEGVAQAYLFRCARGHEWKMLGSVAFLGSWCTLCRTQERQQRGLEAMRAIAAERGGLCVSDAYINNNTRLEWECARGHRWLARPRQITSGNWCAQCVFLSLITNEKTRRKRRYESDRAKDC